MLWLVSFPAPFCLLCPGFYVRSADMALPPKQSSAAMALLQPLHVAGREAEDRGQCAQGGSRGDPWRAGMERRPPGTLPGCSPGQWPSPTPPLLPRPAVGGAAPTA